MENGRYKRERYSDKSFPVYSSVQRGFGRLVQPHFHSDAEFLLVEKGAVAVAVGTEKLTVTAGQALFIAPQQVHFADAVTPDAETHGLVFDTKILSTVFDWPASTVRHFVFEPSRGGAELIAELRSAIGIYGGNGKAYKCRMTAQLLTLSSILLEYGILPDTDGQRFLRTRPAIQYIESHFGERITVNTLSRLVGLCDDRFIRVFKQETGRTPNAYITEYRLNEAMKLLTEGKQSVTEVADLTGFFDAGYFSRIFKKHVGVSPKNYKSGR